MRKVSKGVDLLQKAFKPSMRKFSRLGNDSIQVPVCFRFFDLDASVNTHAKTKNDSGDYDPKKCVKSFHDYFLEPGNREVKNGQRAFRRLRESCGASETAKFAFYSN